MDTQADQGIQYGDWIIIYSVRCGPFAALFTFSSPNASLVHCQNRTQVASDVVTPDKEVQSRYGHFKHNLMVGKPWGIKVSC